MSEKTRTPATEEMLASMDKYWRAANYLSACQLYLLDNPLLEKPLSEDDIKKKIVGHWGTVPGQNFIYTHLNRVIKEFDLDMIYISGPGHGGNAMVAQDWLDGSYQEIYPNITRDKEGMQRLFKQFSFPGGVPSHVAPETPGSINEGGELGYSLAHAFGAVTDNPTLIAATVVGDGEAETGPLATSWQLNKFINAKTDGAVLPILHLNGYKIANPTVFSRIPHEELEAFFYGCGWEPHFVEGSDPMTMHRAMADALDECIEKILAYQADARENGNLSRPRWPMIVLRTPKGWTGPDYVDGLKVEDYWRAHQVPIQPDSPEHIRQIEEWLRSYRPEELFDKAGHPVDEILALCPEGDRRMGMNPHANGGKLLRDLRMPDFRDYAVDVPFPGSVEASDMTELGKFVRDVYKLNEKERNFRSFGPDETASNRLQAVFDETDRVWDAEATDIDDHLAPDGRVFDSMLSEHMCQGWLEGYLLSMPGAVTDYKLEWQWQRYLVGGRMFAAVCTPGPEHAAHAGRTMVILKCDPRLAEAFREQYPEVVPGFYSDKRNWNSVYLDGALPDDVLRDFCGMSYELVFQKLTKRAQREIMEQEEKRSS